MPETREQASPDNRGPDTETLVKRYFPGCLRPADSGKGMTSESCEIVIEPKDLAPYLQTAFFENHIVELSLDRSPKTFFSVIQGHSPDDLENDDGIVEVDASAEPLRYLKRLDYLLVNPLSPSIGNAIVRKVQTVVLRCFFGTSSVELGMIFRDVVEVNGLPTLRFDFPEIARIIRNCRMYRVKVMDDVAAKVQIHREGKLLFTSRLFDMSPKGLAFVLPQDIPLVDAGSQISLMLQVEGCRDLEIAAMVRRIVEVRMESEKRMVCGVQFIVESEAQNGSLERLAAGLQRLHLRDLAEKISGFTDVQIIR